MALLEVDFGKAIEGLASVWQEVIHDDEGKRGEREWDGVQVLKEIRKFGTRYMRITRRISLHSEMGDIINGSSHEADDEVVIEDEDPEALIAPAVKHATMRTVRYDVIHSPSYQVPVLYLTFADASANKTMPLPAADEVYEMIVPCGFKAPMRGVGVMGALSMAEHPVTGVPAYFIHPCRTQEALATFLENASHETNSEQAMRYLMLWFGVIGASVGLSVPVSVAILFSEKRGEVAKLGKC